MKYGRVGVSVNGIDVQSIMKSFCSSSFMSLGWEQFEKLMIYKQLWKYRLLMKEAFNSHEAFQVFCIC